MLLLFSLSVVAEPVRVRHMEGEVHAFLTLSDERGKLLGTADAVNVPAGKAWQSKLTIHFADGSLDEDTALYTQTSVLRLLSDHHVQKGPSFPEPSDVTIDMASGTVTRRGRKDGKETAETDHMDLPADLANGIMPMVLQNFSRSMQQAKVGYLVATPKLRVVNFTISPDGVGRFRVGGVRRTAMKYKLHVDIGGLAGLVAPLVGKQPPDMSAWISSGEAPTFLKLYGFLYLGGPLWQLELASPQW